MPASLGAFSELFRFQLSFVNTLSSFMKFMYIIILFACVYSRGGVYGTDFWKCGVNIYNILQPQSCFRNVTCATVSALICYSVINCFFTDCAFRFCPHDQWCAISKSCDEMWIQSTIVISQLCF